MPSGSSARGFRSGFRRMAGPTSMVSKASDSDPLADLRVESTPELSVTRKLLAADNQSPVKNRFMIIS
ncbi:hypothetical protein V6N13_047797 [Hibiscus sabdariffa]|uniref:Uncharacterized protein n=1 Tax=Hibiscus sabdariffa TaxID=183260 RepID=A0ABR1Z9V9_9ROSI